LKAHLIYCRIEYFWSASRNAGVRHLNVREKCSRTPELCRSATAEPE
jgi:hypothetical protein